MRHDHALVIPIYGELPNDLDHYLAQLQDGGLKLILVDNRARPIPIVTPSSCWPLGAHLVRNHNKGGLAGGLNRGIEAAIALGVGCITLLDQDSRLSADHLQELRRHLQLQSDPEPPHLLVGPCIWDVDRRCWHSPKQRSSHGPSTDTALLISSGTTFAANHWRRLGHFDERMEIDYIDHDWCFRAAATGFALKQIHSCILYQTFGEPHPNKLCRLMGMQLYTPYRHFTAIRNLRLLLFRNYIPNSIKYKELAKMVFKLPAWLLFEPQRLDNFQAILKGLLTR